MEDIQVISEAEQVFCLERMSFSFERNQLTLNHWLLITVGVKINIMIKVFLQYSVKTYFYSMLT